MWIWYFLMVLQPCPIFARELLLILYRFWNKARFILVANVSRDYFLFHGDAIICKDASIWKRAKERRRDISMSRMYRTRAVEEASHKGSSEGERPILEFSDRSTWFYSPTILVRALAELWVSSFSSLSSSLPTDSRETLGKYDKRRMYVCWCISEWLFSFNKLGTILWSREQNENLSNRPKA